MGELPLSPYLAQARLAVLGVAWHMWTKRDLRATPVGTRPAPWAQLLGGCGGAVRSKVPGGVGRLKAVSLPTGPAADKGTGHGFGPSLEGEAAPPWGIIARLISAGQACAPLPRAGFTQPRCCEPAPSWWDGEKSKITLLIYKFYHC